MQKLWKRLFPGSTRQPVFLRPFSAEISVSAKETVLEAALREGIPFPHSCTVGTCATCKCKLVSGTARARSDFAYTLSATELQAGYILACQAHPTSPLTIEVDNSAASLPLPGKFEGKLVEKRALTHDIVQVTIELDSPIHYVAGQFANLRFPGLPSRSYSFSEPPARAGLSTVSFFIRRVEGGQVTEALFAGGLDDQPVEVDGPHGNFHLRVGDGPMICIGGGSGLAPLLSLVLDARLKNIRRRCLFFFGARTQADLYKVDAIRGIEQDWLTDFEFIPVLSAEPQDSGWTGHRGFVTDVAVTYLRDAQIAIASSEAYMCGPPPMIDSAIEHLGAEGLSLSDIHYDKFTDASTAKSMQIAA